MCLSGLWEAIGWLSLSTSVSAVSNGGSVGAFGRLAVDGARRSLWTPATRSWHLYPSTPFGECKVSSGNGEDVRCSFSSFIYLLVVSRSTLPRMIFCAGSSICSSHGARLFCGATSCEPLWKPWPSSHLHVVAAPAPISTRRPLVTTGSAATHAAAGSGNTRAIARGPG